MKKITLPATLLIFSVVCFAQNNRTISILTRADLLQKSKQQKTAGWILLGGGTAITVTGSVILASAVGGARDHNDYTHRSTTGGILMAAGLAAMGGSIPLLISAHRNQKKAMALVITNKEIPILQWRWWSYQSYPALSLKINFGRK
jgi:hypothetical protein